nr:putative endoplasmic reticulum membrane protein [Quercus suber]
MHIAGKQLQTSYFAVSIITSCSQSDIVMKLNNPVTLLSALCCAASATVQVAIYPVADTPHLETLGPTAARAVLAQRLGVDGYHSADLKSSEAINAINEYGLRKSLFGTELGKDTQGFFLVEEESAGTPEGQVFTIHAPPSTSSTRGLYLDLIKQADPVAFASLSDDDLAKSKPFTGSHYFGIFQSTRDLSSFLIANPEARESTTIIYSSEAKNDEVVGNWGTYEMPGVQTPLRKRSQPFEAPLELDPIASIHQSANPSFAVLANSSTKRVTGILPACFSSEALCETMTQNCSGHGRCYHKYTDTAAAKNSPARECYSCQCLPQVSENEKGQTVTTRWGGPACQKKDISTQFWLITLFTVGLVFTVMFAIGSIMEMGSQELPSVIGAGVSGPVKRS